jgi:riboflavin kinase/FMN adenylyltransferase
MNIYKYGEINKNPTCICLGYFDAIHLGHIKIINLAKEIAENKGLELSVLIFTGGKNDSPDIFTFSERLIKLKALKVDNVIYQELNSEFMAKSKDEFLNEIVSYYNVKEIVVGEDFTYGKFAEGNINHLKKFCDNNDIKLNITEKVVDDLGNKISSKNIKSLLINGYIIKANENLGSNYFIRGEVVKGKQLGSKLNFPTANIVCSSNKLLVKQGVYLTCTIINGKLYSSLTNVGTQPTVNGKNNVIETYIHKFSEDIYGKTISVYFIEKIRDIVKFNSLEELKEQLTKDMEYLK